MLFRNEHTAPEIEIRMAEPIHVIKVHHNEGATQEGQDTMCLAILLFGFYEKTRLEDVRSSQHCQHFKCCTLWQHLWPTN